MPNECNQRQQPTGGRRNTKKTLAPPSVETILNKFEKLTEVDDGQYRACCPAHADSRPSLSLKVCDDEQIMVCCHRGCEFADIVKALGLQPSDFAARQSTGQAQRQRQCRQSTTPVSSEPVVPVLQSAGDVSEDWGAQAREFAENLRPETLRQFADSLQLPEEVLRELHVGETESDGEAVLAIPEFNGQGRVVGISLRLLDGGKRFLPGGHRGLALPTNWCDGEGPVYVAEGASDTAALRAMGLAAVGRPSAGTGDADLVQLLNSIPRDHRIFVLGDVDAKADGSWPGKEGAEKIARAIANGLNRNVEIVYPPHGAKDVREWYQVFSEEEE